MKEHRSTILAAVLFIVALLSSFAVQVFVKPDYSVLTKGLQGGNYLEVIEEVEQRLAFRSDDVLLLRTLAQAYLGQATLTNDSYWKDKAFAFLNKSLELYPNDPELNLQLGYCYTLKDDLLSARRAYEKAIFLDERNPRGWSALGTVYETNKALNRALPLYRKAVTLDPKDSVANVALIRNFFREGDSDIGWAKATDFITNTSDVMAKAALYEMLGLDALSKDDSGKARDYFDSVLAITYSRPITLASYAGALYSDSLFASNEVASEQLKAAEQMAARAVLIEPTYAFGYAVLSRIAKLNGEDEKSEKYAEILRDVLPSDDLSTEVQKKELAISFAKGISKINSVKILSVKRLESAPAGIKPGITIINKNTK